MDTSKIVIGAVAGLAIGALAGVLFAPDKGTVTRKKISTKGLSLTDDLKKKYNELIDPLVNKYANVKSDMSNIADKGKRTLEDIENEMRIKHV
jgi:gas vesicle protein